MSADAPAGVGLCGVGLGWRPEIAPLVAALPNLGFVEVVAESVACEFAGSDGSGVAGHGSAVPSHGSAVPSHGSARAELAAYVARGVPVVPHGVGLSLGSADPADLGPVDVLARIASALGSPLVSEHLAFVRGGGLEAGHLLPCPRTREGVAVIARNVARVRAELPVPLALEMPATLLSWPDDELTDAQFVTECLDATGCRLVLDIANVYANAVNTGRDPAAEMAAYPLERIAYCHIAGGVWHDGVYLDTHTHPIVPEVLDLAAELARRAPGVPVLLERDGDYPFPHVLAAELDAVRRAVAPPRAATLPTTEGEAPPARDGGSGSGSIPGPVPGHRLAARQAELVGALVRGTPTPDGFDPVGVARTARTLVRKRWAAVRRHWPVATADVIGQATAQTAAQTAVQTSGRGSEQAQRGTAADLFAAWAAEHRAAGGLPLGGFADGYRFLAWRESAGRLPDAAAADLARARLFWRSVSDGGAAGGGLAADGGGVAPRAWRVWATARARGTSGVVTARAWGSATRPRGVRTRP
jgi:uncharacterized protein (UPF0276 family)